MLTVNENLNRHMKIHKNFVKIIFLQVEHLFMMMMNGNLVHQIASSVGKGSILGKGSSPRKGDKLCLPHCKTWF